MGMTSIQRRHGLLFVIAFSLFQFGKLAHAVEIPLFIQPLSVAYSRFDKHVMLYFEGHPTYEAMEALISETVEHTPDIRIILTRHDQTQVDYFNDDRKLEQFRADLPSREAYPATIAYSAADRNRRPVVNLDFATAEREKVSFRFVAASEPSAYFGGLTDPERHAIATSLPIMTRRKSSLADEASSIRFDGKPYAIPVHTYVPIFFAGMKGYYSDQFRIGVITDQDVGYSDFTLPESLAPGNYWLYRSASGIRRYTIIRISENRVLLRSEREELELVLTGEALALREIRRKAEGHGFDEALTIRFEPYLPYPGGTWPKSVEFSISVGDAGVAVTGAVFQTAGGFSLIPRTPRWAIERAVHTRVTPEERRISSRVGRVKRAHD